MCSINCLFLFICLLIFGDLAKLILPLSVCVALWDFYYMYLFFQDMEDDFNRLVDFLIHFWVSFQNFINALHTKSMRLMVKAAWTFKNGIGGAVLIRSTSWFSFSLLFDTVWVQCILKMSVPILRKFIEL